MLKMKRLPLWFKALAALLLIYSVVAGLLFPVPRLAILNETIRNLYFHVPMWFGMLFLYLYSFIHSIRFLRNGDLKSDAQANEAVNTGVLFGILGLLTGMLWANYTWGTPWTNDPQLNSAAIVMLIYLAYMVLRGSVEEERKRAKLAAVYAIFAFCISFPLLFILPRVTDAGSLHPGKGGNPGFNTYDLDSNMRMVFYPAVLAWIMVGAWLTELRVRAKKVETVLAAKEYE